ncbi:DUF58 domain-containing protein [Shewanella sp. KX20019]|uniref:DUF58 domain-containing protein n=1 Tax=Shewanella sp. KX20019 TaxID=2803864 RepID=UPI0019282370|nr:DUF58 domain-containing protein [Shewanella sp. KX20019]QQX82224.1 DUF58 domain-containing protein [Shewanella sp. KX20019]
MLKHTSVKQRLRNRFSRWLSRRIPAAYRVTLSHKSIFILPTGFGFSWLLLISLLFVFGTNYQNNLVMGLSFLLLSVFNTCIIYSYRNLAGLTLSSTVSPSNTFAGQPCYIPVLLSSANNAFEIQLNFHGHGSEVVKKVTDDTSVSNLCVDRTQRGTLTPGRIKVESRFPLGLCRVWSHVDLDITQVIYPKPIKNQHPLRSHPQSSNNSPELGKFVAGVDEFKGLKQYVRGEPLKQIAWKQWAQGRGMLTKEFQQPQGAPLWLMLESDTHDLELNLSYLSWQAQQLSQNQQIFGLSIGATIIEPAQGEQHRVNVQTHLALYKCKHQANPNE